MRRQRLREHVGAVHVAAAVVLRARLALGAGLHQEAAEVRDQPVDLVGLVLPPGAHPRIQRVGGRQPGELPGRREARRQEDADAVRPQHVGQRRGLLQPRLGEHLRARVDVVEHRGVDAQRGVGARVVHVARRLDVGERPPVPDRLARVAALHRAIEVVPVIEHAPAHLGRGRLVQARQVRAHLRVAQPGEAAMEQAAVGVGRDERDRMAAQSDRAQRVAFLAQRGERQRERGDGGQRLWRRQDDRAIAQRVSEHGRAAAHLRHAAMQLVHRGRHHRGSLPGNDQRRGSRLQARLAGGGERAVPQPEVVAVLDLPLRGLRQDRQRE